MNLTLADTTIAYYDSKYRYRLWRPVTALRELDPTWTPLVNTPADPSYPGAHSALAAAGAEVLEAVFDRDIPITVNPPRSRARHAATATPPTRPPRRASAGSGAASTGASTTRRARSRAAPSPASSPTAPWNALS